MMLKGYSRLCCIRTKRSLETFNHLGCVDDDDVEPSECASVAVALEISSTDSPVSFETDGTPFAIHNYATCCICINRQFFVGEL